MSRQHNQATPRSSHAEETRWKSSTHSPTGETCRRNLRGRTNKQNKWRSYLTHSTCARPQLPPPSAADAVANKARIQRGDKATEVDEALNGGAPAFHTAMAKQGVMHGIAVGGCCELSTSAHHLVAKIGEEQGYRLAESSGMDIEDAITIATRLLKGRIAKQV